MPLIGDGEFEEMTNNDENFLIPTANSRNNFQFYCP